MARPPDETVVEERQELMVSPAGGIPTFRTAHFINPTVTSNTDLHSLSLSFTPAISPSKNTPSVVQFRGRPKPQKGWKTWVNRLQPAYQVVWQKAGIYEAILSSTYLIRRENDLVIALAERWRAETNTFIFPWGEATITLEDMVVLGGYSVLGDPVFSPLTTEDLTEVETSLRKAHREIGPGSGSIISQYAWMKHFMESGDPFEHPAFLALWLSRYVFPTVYGVGRHVFSIAIHLSRGTPIALAPAVLASIYRDLSVLKKSVSERRGKDLPVTLYAPFQLVQLWAWERFPTLRPQPNPMKCGEPRVARWRGVKKLRAENVRKALEMATDCFQWRPYATVLNNWTFTKFYRESEDWVLVKSDMDTELESFARCLRACVLVGLDCLEQYLPNRVAMQFGMDQDLPACVAGSNGSPEIAWRDYSRPIVDTKLYVPHRLFESDVTMRYLEWWKHSLVACRDANWRVVRQRSKACKRLPRRRRLWEDWQVCSKYVGVENVDEDSLTVAEMLTEVNRDSDFEDASVGDGKPLPDTHFQSPSSSAASASAGKKMVSVMELLEVSKEGKALAARPLPETEVEDVDEAKSISVGDYDSYEIPKLEVRIGRLEKLVAELKAAKSDHGFEKKHAIEGPANS